MSSDRHESGHGRSRDVRVEPEMYERWRQTTLGLIVETRELEVVATSPDHGTRGPLRSGFKAGAVLRYSRTSW